MGQVWMPQTIWNLPTGMADRLSNGYLWYPFEEPNENYHLEIMTE